MKKEVLFSFIYVFIVALVYVISSFFAENVLAAEAGYSLLHQRQRAMLAESSRGVEGRINFGGSVTDRYSGDRWSLAIGAVSPRRTIVDNWIPEPEGGWILTDKLDSYYYINFSHRWYTRRNRFEHAPQLRFFVGTGVAYRNATTCGVLSRIRPSEEWCYDGTAYVSSNWAFHQTFGFKWRERLELAFEHDSTGKISGINLGDDIIRLTLYPIIGRK